MALFGTIAIIATGLALVVTFYDIPYPNDSDLRISQAPIPDDENALPLLLQLRQALKTEPSDYPNLSSAEMSDIWTVFSKTGKYPDFYLEKNSDAVNLFWAASEKRGIQFTQLREQAPLLNESAIWKAENNDVFVSLFNVSKLLRARWNLLLENNDWKTILHEGEIVQSFAKKIASANAAGTQYFMLAIVINHAAQQSINDCLRFINEREICLLIAGQLKEHELTERLLANTIKYNYEQADYILKNMELFKPMLPGVSLSTHPYFYKPNITRRFIITDVRLTLQGLQTGSVPEQEYQGLRTSLKHYIKPNSTGENFYHFVGTSYKYIYIQLLRQKACVRMASCAFAIRAYWLEHGVLPLSLDALVPTYLVSVPEDPFVRKPMPYDPSKALLYCAGPERKMDDGSYAFAPKAEPFGKRPFIFLDWSKEQVAETAAQ